MITSYKCDIPEKKVNILLRCLRQSADRKTEVVLYNISSKTLCGRLCTPVITVIKKMSSTWSRHFKCYYGNQGRERLERNAPKEKTRKFYLGDISLEQAIQFQQSSPNNKKEKTALCIVHALLPTDRGRVANAVMHFTHKRGVMLCLLT